MKKVLIPLCILLFSASLKGQVIKSFNVAGGLTWGKATLWENDSTVADDYDVQKAWGFEAGVAFYEGKFISLGLQAGYTIKGQQSISRSGPDSLPSSVKFYKNYLFVAPKLTFHPDFKRFRPYIFISPRLDYFSSGRYVYVLDGKTIEDKTSKDLYKDVYNQYVFSVAYGGGIEQRFGQVGIGIEVQRMTNITPEMKLIPGAKYISEVYLGYLTFKYYLNK